MPSTKGMFGTAGERKDKPPPDDKPREQRNNLPVRTNYRWKGHRRPPVSRDDLEATLRRILAGLPASTRPLHNQIISEFLSVADAYAVYVGGITAERRAELEAALKKRPAS